MTPEEFQSFLLSQSQDLNGVFSLGIGAANLQLSVPQAPLPASAPSSHIGEARHGTRGGKKPLRAWQQQLCELETELSKRELELKKAQEEGERLRHRLKVLETVLPVREELSRLLRQRRQASSGQVFERAVPSFRVIEEPHSASFGAPSTSNSEASQTADNHRRTSEPPAKDPLSPPPSSIEPAGAAGVLAHWPRPLRDTAIVPRSEAAAAAAESAPNHNEFIPFSIFLPTNRAPAHVIRSLCAFWNDWVRDAALVLHTHDARPHDPGTQQALMELRGRLWTAFGPPRVEYSSLLTDLISVNVKTGERETPPPSFWVPVAQGMRCTADQLSGSRAALVLYQERLDRLLAERQALLGQLAALLPSRQLRSGLPQSSVAGPSGQLVEDLTAQLCRNVAMEGVAVEVVKDFMGSSHFSLVQICRASVLSYPYFPDGIAILNTIVATCSPEAKGSAS